nr:hypothetical protein [Candidatus Cloacimonadota bacterium]
MVTEYKVRGNYLNYKVQRYLLGLENDSENMTGFLPAELEYLTSDGEENTLKLSGMETIYFCKNAAPQQLHLLELLLKSDQDEKATEEKDKILADFSQYYRQIYDYHDLSDNQYLVNSSSKQAYTADQISHKGVNLLKMSQEGYPVPDFCILTSKSYFLPSAERKKYVQNAIAILEKLTFRQLDSAENPLIFAVRSAMPSYIPGVMPTFLNVGVTRKSYLALAKIYGETIAKKIYLNNLKTIHYNLFEKNHNHLQNEDLETQIDYFYSQIAVKDERLLKDALYQVIFFVKQAHEYFERNQDLLLTFIRDKEKYPSLILQKMVWTVLGDESYPGVLYSRHSRTGLGIQIESLPNIFGDEIMTGHTDIQDHEFFDRKSIKEVFPAIYHFEPLLWKLELKYRSPVTVEFAAESSQNTYLFAVLQLNTSELTGRATLLSSIDLYKKGVIDAKRVLELIKPYHLTQIFSERIDDSSFQNLKFFCSGVSILPRTAVTAKLYFSAAKALTAKREGYKVVICKDSFFPADTVVMGEVNGILSLTPAAIHVVTACRGYGVPAFLNLEKFGVSFQQEKLINEDGLEISEGDWITISSKKGMIFLGKADYIPARFQRYLDGEKLEMKPKEERVFINMSHAFKVYDELLENLKLEQIVKLDELIK